MDQSEKISAEIAAEEASSAPPAWRWLGTIGLRCYFAGPSDVDPATLSIPGCGPCGPYDSDGELPAGFNLIRDPEFAADWIGWIADWDGTAMVSLDGAELPPADRRSPSGGCLEITVPLDMEAKRETLTLTYAGEASERGVAAEPGIRYRFGCTLDGDLKGADFVLEFLDPEGQVVGREKAAYRAANRKRDTGGSVAATAPDGTAALACRAEIQVSGAKSDENAILLLTNPSLRAEDGDGPGDWVAGTIKDSAFRKALADTDSCIFHADRRPDQPLGKDDTIEVNRDRSGRPVLVGPSGASAAKAQIEFWPIKDDLIEIRVAGFSGPLLLAVDGAVIAGKWIIPSAKPLPVSLRIPTRLLDGDYHVLQVFDGKSLALLGSDFAHLGDQTTDWSSLRDSTMPPYPAHLSPKAARRMEAMRRQLAWFGERETLTGDDSWLLTHLYRIEEALTAGLERNRDFFPLRFPETKQPTVSIVIPVHGQYAATFHCLCSLLFARSNADYEIIVVDDGSQDETAKELVRHTGIRIVSRDTAGGFIAACNAGAAEAKGGYVLFLNNDCEVTPGWLDELVASFDIFPGTGAACPQLLHSDGRLQVAGTIVWRNGKPQNIGWNKNPRDPRYAYSRDTDYLAGAALITLKSLWDDIGGFETDLSPAYFEDTWYSFAVREAGYRTIYCATSTVYHTRGVSNGTDPDAENSVKRFQTINHPKFKRRWHKSYQEHGAYGGDAMLEKDREAKKRVLMIGWRVPRPDQDAGSYSTVQEIKMLQDLGCKVTYLPTNLEYAGRYTEALQRIGVESMHAPFATSVADFLAERGGEFDVILVSRYTILRPLIPAIRDHSPKARLALNVEDLNFVREMRRAIAGADAAREDQVHELREDELQVIRQADLVLSYSKLEVAILEGLMGSRPKIAKMPWVEEPRPGANGFKQRNDLCFLGSHQHPPNAEAVETFAGEIAPKLGGKQRTLHVYGSHWPAEPDAADKDAIAIEGFAPDIAETFDRHRVFVAPLKSGAGIKGKVLLAMAHGLPTVLSPIAAEGIDVTSGTHCLIAETPDEWAAAIEQLSSDEQLWTSIRDAALALIERNYARDNGVEKLRRILETVDIFV